VLLRPALLLGLAAMLGLAALNGGCGAPPDGTSDKSTGGLSESEIEAMTPQQRREKAHALLGDMVAAYAAAAKYSDGGQLNLIDQRGERPAIRPLSYSVRFERPNRVRMAAYDAVLGCDGNQLKALVRDERTADFDGQIVVRDAPEELSGDNAFVSPLAVAIDYLAGTVGRPPIGPPPSYLLLVDPAFREGLLDARRKLDLLPPETVLGHKCLGVRLLDDAMTPELWIDPAANLLRRMVLPTETAGVVYVIDFHEARFDVPRDDSGGWLDGLEGEREVQYLVEPPTTMPVELLGQPVPQFTFKRQEAADVTPASIKGKITVLAFWALDDPNSLAMLRMMEVVYAQLKDVPTLAFYVVSTDPPGVSDAEIRATLAEAEVTIPWVRAPEIRRSNVLSISALPMHYIVDAKGIVQVAEPGLNPALRDVLPLRINTLRDGRDIFPIIQAEYEKGFADYKRELALAAAGKSPLEFAGVAQPTPPRRHNLVSIWTAADRMEHPGNLLAVGTGEACEIYAVDRERAVARLDAAGSLAARVSLPLAEGTIVSSIRTAVDGAGRRRFVLFGRGQPRLHLLDERLSPTLVYPKGENVLLGDVQIADLDGDGELELLTGYLGETGVHRVTLAGQSVWRNRRVANVSQLALPRLGEKKTIAIFCAMSGPEVAPLDADGRLQPRRLYRGTSLYWLRSAENDPGDASLCGISLGGNLAVPSTIQASVVGLGAEGGVMWEYELPKGFYSSLIEPLTWGGLLADEGPGQWIVAGADGSVHILSAQGELLERFNYGRRITGIAVADLPGGPALLLATARSVEAIRLERK
jgi:hypothetical protein